MDSRSYAREKGNLIFGAVWTLVGLSAAAYLGWAYSVSAKVVGYVSKYEYDEHGHPSLVVEFTDPIGGTVREIRTTPCGAQETPELPLQAPVGVLVPPGDHDPLFDEPDGYLIMVGFWSFLGLGLTLWSWFDLRGAKNAPTE